MKIKIEGATLLSEEEYEENKKYINIAYCWLRSSSFTKKTYNYKDSNDKVQSAGYLTYINANSEVEYESWFEYRGHFVHPALICNTKCLNLGEEVFINDKPYIVINNYLLASFSIGCYPFNEHREDGNDYNSSYVKSIVDNWFNANFQGEVEIIEDLDENEDLDEYLDEMTYTRVYWLRIKGFDNNELCDTANLYISDMNKLITLDDKEYKLHISSSPSYGCDYEVLINVFINGDIFKKFSDCAIQELDDKIQEDIINRFYSWLADDEDEDDADWDIDKDYYENK